MKKENLSGLLIILVITQIFLIIGLFNLSSKVEEIYYIINNIGGNINNKIDSIENEVISSIEEQATLIESVEIDFGKFDKKNLTIPVTYTIIPKEFSEHAILSLQFDEETLEMERNGARFKLTVDTDIFAYEIDPSIIISENGKLKTEKKEELLIYSLIDFIYPEIYIESFEGFTSKKDKYRFEGTLAYYKDFNDLSNQLDFMEAKFVIKLDDTIAFEENIDIEDLNGYSFDKEIPISEEEECKVYIIVKDELNLEHHYLIYNYNSEHATEVEVNSEMYSGVIYSQEGEQLWPPANY